jgi:lysozyme family protein
MKSNFNDCLTRLLKDEGGYTNDPRDPGGATNYGITLKDYRLYINSQGTANDVRNMKLNDAQRIYKSKYWDALNCDSLSSGVDYSVFDYGVNSGLGRPRKDLQRFKDKTGADLINAINDERMAFLRSLGTFGTFGKGWTRRVTGVRAHSLELASKKDNATGSSVFVGLAALAAAFSQYWHQHEKVIIIGGVLTAIAIGIIVHMYRNKGK